MMRAAIALLFCLSAFAAQAQPPATEPEAAQPAAEEATVITSEDAAKPDTRCVRDTGTRLATRDDKGCTGAPGDSYSREDIDRSGATDTADALRKLSPRATVRRGN
jgi:hypothetical protein